MPLSDNPMDRVTRKRPCPICRRDDWCLVAPDGSAAICQRVESDHRCGDAGWLHRLTDPQPKAHIPRPRPPAAPAKPPSPANRPDAEATARECEERLPDGRRRQLAELVLGLPEDVLKLLDVGYVDPGPHGGRKWPRYCWTFPERDGAGRIVGIICRYSSGRKMAWEGMSRGLSIPSGWRNREGPVFLVEGPSDTLALTALGLAAIGRPSNRGGVDHLAAVLGGPQVSGP
jgi:hypothetical protein